MALLAGAIFGAPLAHSATAIINNGTIQLGINDKGNLNVPGGTISGQGTTTVVGIRYMPTNNEATGDGCACEGWGAADATTGVTGYANESTGTSNITVTSFTFTASTAKSVVEIKNAGAPFMEVTHDYRPSPKTPNLYEVVVTIRNLSAAAINPRYRRVMDWDVEPTRFSEYSTINKGSSAEIEYTSDNGFATANPLGSRGSPLVAGAVGNFTDLGPADHGALFDFKFAPIAPGGSKTFTTFYGAAGDEVGAVNALSAVGGEIYSFGQPNTDATGSPAGTPKRPDIGKPNTFIFAFAGVGGTPIFSNLTLTPADATNPIGTSHTVTATLSATGGGSIVGQHILFAVTGVHPMTGDGLTNSTGKATLTWAGTKLGDDTVTACYDKNNNNTCDSGELTATARKRWVPSNNPPVWVTPPTPLAGAAFTGRIGDMLSISLKADDPDVGQTVHIAGLALPSKSVLASIDGKPAEATFSWTPTAAGDATLTFGATDSLSASITRSFSVRVVKRTAKIVVGGYVIADGQITPVTISSNAILTDAVKGTPLSGKEIKFTAGTGSCRATTDAQGKATCTMGFVAGTVPSLLESGYTGSFAGDATYEPVSAKGSLVCSGAGCPRP